MTVPELSADEKATVARFGIHDPAGSLADAARRLSTAATMSYADAHATLSHALALEETHVWMDETANWAEHPSTVPVEAFMVEHQLSRGDMGEMLREYRSETGWSPFEIGDRDVLDSDFLNWHRWERLA